MLVYLKILLFLAHLEGNKFQQNTGDFLDSKSFVAVGQSEQGTNIALLIDNSAVSSVWPFRIAEFDDNWRYVQLLGVNETPIRSQVERIFNFDTDGNGVVGVTGTFDQSSPSAKKVSYRTVQSNGNLTLLQDELSRSCSSSQRQFSNLTFRLQW